MFFFEIPDELNFFPVPVQNSRNSRRSLDFRHAVPGKEEVNKTVRMAHGAFYERKGAETRSDFHFPESGRGRTDSRDRRIIVEQRI